MNQLYRICLRDKETKAIFSGKVVYDKDQLDTFFSILKEGILVEVERVK